MIKVNNVSKTFRKSHFLKKSTTTTVLENINFQIHKGEFVAILGNNGCGKSTLAKCLCGVLKPTKGEVQIQGKNIFSHRKLFTNKIGVVFNQKPSFLIDISVEDNFDFFRSIYNINKEEFNKKIDFIDKHIGIKKLFRQQYRRLSFGQRVRCEIASVILHNPEYIFLDEPTIGLDGDTKKGLFDLLKYYNETYNSTILIITHDMNYLVEHCTRGIVMHEGRVICNSTIEEIAKATNQFEVITLKYNKIYDKDKAKELFKKANSHVKSENKLVLPISENDEQKIMQDIVNTFEVLSLSKEMEIDYKEVLNHANTIN